MELTIPKTQFVCVDYPAIVQNEDKMLKTLGGVTQISKVFSLGYFLYICVFRGNDAVKSAVYFND